MVLSSLFSILNVLLYYIKNAFFVKGHAMNSTKNTSYSAKHFKFPQSFLDETSSYFTLHDKAKLLYMFLRNRNSLSVKNNFTDNQNNICVYCTRKFAAKKLRCTEKTISKCFEELRECNLISEKVQGCNKANIIYVKDICADTQKQESVQVMTPRNKEIPVCNADQINDAFMNCYAGDGDEDYSEFEILFAENELKPDDLGPENITDPGAFFLQTSKTEFSNTYSSKLESNLSKANVIDRAGTAIHEYFNHIFTKARDHFTDKDDQIIDQQSVDLLQELKSNILAMYQSKYLTVNREIKKQPTIRSELNKLTETHLLTLLQKIKSLNANIRNVPAYVQTMIFNEVSQAHITTTIQTNQIKEEFERLEFEFELMDPFLELSFA